MRSRASLRSFRRSRAEPYPVPLPAPNPVISVAAWTAATKSPGMARDGRWVIARTAAGSTLGVRSSNRSPLSGAEG